MRVQQAASTLAALGTLAVIVFTWISLKQVDNEHTLTREGQVTDRYNAAVGNIGDESLEVRLGGIHALHRIMEDSPRDQPSIVDVLSTYIRSHAKKAKQYTSVVVEPSSDVQAALTALGTRDVNHDGIARVNLSGADLGGAYLVGAKLAGADLTNARLLGAYLSGADLTNANLGGVNLKDAYLRGAFLHEARLITANLDDAHLAYADLTNADLEYAALRDADLTKANLTEANLSYADLTEADLHDANLTNANLTKANLKDALTPGTMGLPSGRP
ncbi:pentapeptide repeat-containing protein [Streptomyces sp. NPDC056399]|uniref:pentapeptide repeat-containing protein n=1 Tax=Streptomyces sp. NPDC056399 TaxID=3345807 RepID=UPI0035E20B8D